MLRAPQFGQVRIERGPVAVVPPREAGPPPGSVAIRPALQPRHARRDGEDGSREDADAGQCEEPIRQTSSRDEQPEAEPADEQREREEVHPAHDVLGACWAGGSDETPPETLDCAVIFAPVGALVPAALKAVRKGGRVVCAGIHMSDIPSFPYSLLWEEREVVSVANLTRGDGLEFFAVVPKAGIVTETVAYPLAEANAALSDLRDGGLQGAAVLVP